MISFEKRIYLGIGLIIVGFLPLIAFAFMSLQRINQEDRHLLTENGTQLVNAERLRYINSTLSSLMPIYVLSGDRDLLNDFDERYAQFETLLSKIIENEEDPQALEILKKIESLSVQNKTLSQPGIALRKKGASAAEANSYFVKNTQEVSGQIIEELNHLVAKETSDLNTAKIRTEKTMNWVTGLLIGLSVFAFFLLAVVSRLLMNVLRQKKEFDQTREKLLAQEQILSQARKEAVEVVAHDLKNPLGAIKMSLNLVKEDFEHGVTDTQIVKESLNIANRSADSMQNLIHDLLDHAKIEAGGLVLEKNKCDLSILVKDLAARFQTLAKNRNINLIIEQIEPDLIIDCDQGRIEQVLSNLAGNALKFTPSRGAIKIKAFSKDSDVFISIEDNGAGMDEAQLPHIFDRFWQVKETAKQGNGLGLAIVKAIVDGHKGEISVISHKGKGSKFTVRLPRVLQSNNYSGVKALTGPA